MHILLRPFLVLAIVLTAACEPAAIVSEPIAGPPPAAHDERIRGAWIAYLPEGGQSQISLLTVIINQDEEGRLKLTFGGNGVSSAIDGGEAFGLWYDWDLTGAVINGKTYYSGRLVRMLEVERSNYDGNVFSALGREELDAHPAYILGWPEIDANGNLVLRLMTEEELTSRGFTHRTAEEGLGEKLQEVVKSTVVVTSAELAELITGAKPGELFRGTLGPFIRVDKAVPQENLWNVEE